MKIPPSMTNAQVLDLMLQRIGNRKSPHLRGVLLTELNLKLGLLESRALLPWFLEETWNFSTTVGERAYNLPEDFLLEVEDGALVMAENGTPVGYSTKVEYEKLPLETGTPANYALFGNQLVFGGVPNKVYEAQLPYYASGGFIADNAAPVTNPWLQNVFEIPVLQTLLHVSDFHLQAPDLSLRFATQLAPINEGFWRRVEARRHINADYKIED